MEFTNEKQIEFSKLDKSKQELVLSVLYDRAKGYTLEYCKAGYSIWEKVSTLNLYGHFVYRVIKEVVKPTINWDHVNKDYNYLAEDMKGYTYLYSHRPSLGNTMWFKEEGMQIDALSHSSYKVGNVGWKDSLVVRPGYEEV